MNTTDETEWTVCPRCGTQIAIDDYQEAAGMCDACIIDTMEDAASEAYEQHQRICSQTHQPRGYRCNLVSPFTYRQEDMERVQVSDDDWRAMQDAVSAISTEQNARNFPRGFAAAVAEMLSTPDEHAMYTRMEEREIRRMAHAGVRA